MREAVCVKITAAALQRMLVTRKRVRGKEKRRKRENKEKRENQASHTAHQQPHE
jgi:hypothetical protein